MEYGANVTCPEEANACLKTTSEVLGRMVFGGGCAKTNKVGCFAKQAGIETCFCRSNYCNGLQR